MAGSATTSLIILLLLLLASRIKMVHNSKQAKSSKMIAGDFNKLYRHSVKACDDEISYYLPDLQICIAVLISNPRKYHFDCYHLNILIKRFLIYL